MSIKARSSGLRWCKADLHVHTPASADYVGPTITPDGFVKAAVTKGVDIIAVTDHNTGEWIDRLMLAARGTPLTVLPGVEISVAGGEGGIHVIALFDKTATTKTIESLLSRLDINPTEFGKTDTISPKSVEDALKAISEAGGLAVLAHADSTKGVLSDMRGQARIRVMNLPELAAVEVKNVTKFRALLDGTDKDYRRRLPVYRASDNRDRRKEGHSVDGIGSRFTWLKLDSVDLEGLRQCFCDADVRIRTDLDAASAPGADPPRIEDVEISQGFLQGRFEFHQGLNCVIGGKGVGKSLLIEAIRFALDQPSPSDRIADDMWSKLEAQVGPGGVVSVTVRTEGGHRLRVTRTYDSDSNPIAISRVDDGKAIDGRIAELFPILAYSQTEAIEIARDPSAQLQLIDSFLDLSAYQTTVADLRKQLAGSDKKVAEAVTANAELSEVRTDLATKQEQVEALDDVLKSDEYEDYKNTEQFTAWYDDMAVLYNDVESILKGAIRETEGVLAPEMPDQSEGGPQLDATMTRWEADRTRVVDALNKLVKDGRKKAGILSKETEAWGQIVVEKEATYKSWAEEAGGERPQVMAKRTRLKNQHKKLGDKVRALEATTKRLPSLLKARDALLDDLDDAVASIFETRSSMYDRLTELSDGRLQLKLSAGENREKLVEALHALVRGSYLRDKDLRELAASVKPRLLVTYVLSRDPAGLAGDALRDIEWAEKVIDVLLSADSFQRVLALQHRALVEDTPEIRLQKDDGQYYELQSISIGQKCTALMIIALAEGQRPVIIDQPEDALDIPSVYADVTTQLRARKDERQFIITTHNATVAVAGDSDLFHVLRGTASSAEVVAKGAIDVKEVRDEVIQHLEGGEAPFRLKSKKYGIQIQ